MLTYIDPFMYGAPGQSGMRRTPIGKACLTVLRGAGLVATYTVKFTDLDLLSREGVRVREAAKKRCPSLRFALDRTRKHLKIDVPRDQRDELACFVAESKACPFRIQFNPPYSRSYKPIRKLGTGAMGVTYEAICAKTGRRVAVKTLRSDLTISRSDQQRFNREVRYMAGLNSPYVVQILDFDLDVEDRWLAMELAPGGSLAGLIKTAGRMDAKWALEVHRQIALGLDALHRLKLIHRDVKPANILLWDRAAKLADLGQAIQVGSVQITSPKEQLGTFDYMSPEQRTNAHRATHKSDVYSLGVSLFECLGGKISNRSFNKGMLGLLAGDKGERKILDSIEPLFLRMIADRPSARPMASYVASTLEQVKP